MLRQSLSAWAAAVRGAEPGLTAEAVSRTIGLARISRLGGLALVYPLHFPLVGHVKLMLWPLLPAQSEGWMLAHYVITVAITALASIVVALLLSQFAPRLFSVLNGGGSGLALRTGASPASASLPLGS